MIGLKPLESIYLGGKKRQQCLRVAVLCRSEDKPCPLDKNDTWVFQHFHKKIFHDESHVDWDRLQKTKCNVSYTPFGNEVISLSKGSLYENLLHNVSYKLEEDEAILTLHSTI
jgi:hypothetical protein